MTTDDRSLERAARSWLEEGPTRAPDRAVDAALVQITTTPQERDLRIPWRLPTMFNNRLAVAALALVLVVAGGGFALSRLGAVGGPGASPTLAPTGSPPPIPTTSPSLAPSPTPMTLGATEAGRALAPGTYRVADFAVPFTVALPAGWVNDGYKPNSFAIRNGKNEFLALVVVKSVYADPCHTETAPKTVAPGVDPLLTALSKMKGFTVTGVSDVLVSGGAAKSFTLANSIDLQKAACTHQQVLWIGRDGDDNPVLETPKGADVLWIVDARDSILPPKTVLIGGPADIVSTISFGSPG
jgi:hypothetical protein